MAQKVSEYYIILRKRHGQRLRANCVMPATSGAKTDRGDVFLYE